MLWFWGLCGAFAFSAGPLGVTLFGESCPRKRYAAGYTFVVSLVTGAIFAQAFAQPMAQGMSSGIIMNGVRIAVRVNDVGAATALGVGCNAWWPLVVRRVGRWVEKGDGK